MSQAESHVPPTDASACRIEVKRCGECPFVDEIYSEWTCEHPAARARGSRLVSYGDRPGAPPSWCPLRGAVTLVAGPRS
jgi:hypothetical protein